MEVEVYLGEPRSGERLETTHGMDHAHRQRGGDRAGMSVDKLESCK